MEPQYYSPKQNHTRELKAISFMFIIVLIGTIGYITIEDYSFINAVYMSILTISTVGYGEIEPLSDYGRLFTSIYILVSISVMAYAVTVLSEKILRNALLQNMETRRIKRKISKMKNHIIIVGIGKTGRQAMLKLQQRKKEIVIIEKNIQKTELLPHLKGITVIIGDATIDEVLIKANIKEAKHLITTSSNDADNLFTVLSAKQLNPKLNIVSRSSSESTNAKLKIAGASRVIMSDKVGGEHMAALIAHPDVVEFVENLSFDESGNSGLVELSVESLPKGNIGKSIREINIRKMTGCNLIGYKTKGGEYIINPSADMTVHKGGKMIVLGNKEQVGKLNNICV